MGNNCLQEVNAGGGVDALACGGSVGCVGAADGGACVMDGGEGVDALAEELARQEGVLRGVGVRSAQEQVRVVLGVMLERVADRSADVGLILGGSGNRKEGLLELVGDEVARVAGGSLSVPRYNPELKTQQEVRLYVGTHWVRVENERFFQWVKECCGRMGMPSRKVKSPSFMAEACQVVEYRFSGCWDGVPPPPGVALLNLANGTLEVDGEGRRRLRGHRREDYFLNCLPFCYDPGAESALWVSFLERVLPDAGCRRLLQEFVANALVGGAVRLDVMLVLRGGGSNGKSVLLEVLNALAGRENVSNISLSDLTTDMNARSGFEHKLLNTSSESDVRWGAPVLKQLTSHEPVLVKRLYKDMREMTDYGYLVAAVNEMPRAEMTHAFYRRLRILPFDVTISADEADPALAEKLKGELSGVLNWFLAGLPGLMSRQRLVACGVCDEELSRYRASTDVVYLFVEECCERSGRWEKASTLFSSFTRFCAENALVSHLSLRRFIERLKKLNVEHSIRHKQSWFQLTLL